MKLSLEMNFTINQEIFVFLNISFFQNFANFFRKNAHNLNNSFLFVLGDHGLRFGEFRRTGTGFIEDNNPLLTVLFYQSIMIISIFHIFVSIDIYFTDISQPLLIPSLCFKIFIIDYLCIVQI